MTFLSGSSFPADYDVIVIGSGPAGCSAALNCRGLGLSVLMVTSCKEDELMDEYGPSESLHPGILSLLGHLGARSAIERSFTGTYAGIKTGDKIHYFTNDSREQLTGFHVNKIAFNSALMQLVRSRKISVLFNGHVKEFVKVEQAIAGIRINTGRTIIAKYIIDASGTKRVAADTLGLEEHFLSPPLVAWSGKVTGMNNAGHFFDDGIATFIPKNNGWTWIAPEKDNSCTFTSLAVKGRQTFTIPAELEGKGDLQKIIKCNMRWRCCKTVAMEGLIICGDAGLLLDPAAGQGVLNAMYSGIKAAETISYCLDRPEKEQEFLSGYAHWFMTETERKVALLKQYYIQSNISLTSVKGKQKNADFLT